MQVATRSNKVSWTVAAAGRNKIEGMLRVETFTLGPFSRPLSMKDPVRAWNERLDAKTRL